MFIWRPNWFHHGESLWSIANKIAFANVTSIADVLLYLGGIVSSLREKMLFLNARDVVHVADALKLGSSDVASSVSTAIKEVPYFEQRVTWRIGIRYCPLCMSQHVHRALFQHRDTKTCQFHGVALLDGCPRCRRAFDPLCEAPWRCNFCGEQIAPPPGDWLREFVSDGFEAGSSAASSPVGYLNMGDAGGFSSFTSQNWKLMAEVFEVHAAVVHALLGAHKGCISAEVVTAQSYQSPVSFNCPIAAAASLSAQRLGIGIQGSGGYWPRYRASSGAHALFELESTLCLIESNSHEAVIRGSVLFWVAEALAEFLQAHQEKKEFADWRVVHRPCGFYMKLATLKSHTELVTKITSLVFAHQQDCRAADLAVAA